MRFLTILQQKKSLLQNFLLLGATVLWGSCNLISESYYQGKLQGMVAMVNQKCPQEVANGVRLDSASVRPSKTLVYHYTMTEIELKDIDTTIWKKNVDSALIVEIKKTTDLKDLRDHNVTFVYDYFDKNKQQIAEFPITAKMYNDKK